MIDPKNVERVAIVGAGTIGSGWAVHYLACGKTVTVSDPAPDAESRVRAFVDKAWAAVAGADPRGGAVIPSLPLAIWRLRRGIKFPISNFLSHPVRCSLNSKTTGETIAASLSD